MNLIAKQLYAIISTVQYNPSMVLFNSYRVSMTFKLIRVCLCTLSSKRGIFRNAWINLESKLTGPNNEVCHHCTTFIYTLSFNRSSSHRALFLYSTPGLIFYISDDRSVFGQGIRTLNCIFIYKHCHCIIRNN
jgi:hypothetical protein